MKNHSVKSKKVTGCWWKARKKTKWELLRIFIFAGEIKRETPDVLWLSFWMLCKNTSLGVGIELKSEYKNNGVNCRLLTSTAVVFRHESCRTAGVTRQVKPSLSSRQVGRTWGNFFLFQSTRMFRAFLDATKRSWYGWLHSAVRGSSGQEHPILIVESLTNS